MPSLVSGNLSVSGTAVAVIMAGGSGTRFWPLSRKKFPKQFLPLGTNGQSLIRETGERLESLVGSSGILVVTASHQAALVSEHLPEACVLAEPCAKNTAPCLGFSAEYLLQTVGDLPMVCLPADHLIGNTSKITKLYQQAIALSAKEDCFVTLGIPPTRPETGYGYIRSGGEYQSGEVPVMQVQAFVEKPDRATAESYLAEGSYFWNSGMFIMRPSVLLHSIKEHLPETAQLLEQIGVQMKAGAPAQEVAKLYSELTPVSIDVGVMEKAANVYMLPAAEIDWSDVGAWDSWLETLTEAEKDAKQNIARGDAVFVSSERCAVVGDKKLVAVVGLSDVVIVDTEDALLVCRADRAQEVKNVVEHLGLEKREELL